MSLKQEGILLSFEDRDSLLAVSPDGLMAQSRHQQRWAGVRCTVGVLQGIDLERICYGVIVTFRKTLLRGLQSE